MTQRPTITLTKNATMRDVGDYCKKHGVPALAQGMIELPPPMKLRELASSYALSNDVHQYLDRYGEQIFLCGVHKLLKRCYGVEISMSNLLACQGVSAGCVTALLHLKNENKTRIGLVSPFYTYHLRECVTVFNKEPAYIHMFNDDALVDGELNFDVLEDALVKGLDCIMICNPHNPTGRVWKKDEMIKTIEMCAKYDCMVVLDECYCDMVWEPAQMFTPLPPFVDKMYNNVIIVRGFSKVLGCQSWRIAYVIAHESLIPKLMHVHDTIYICLSWLQCAMGDFLENHTELFEKHVQEIGQLMRGNWEKLSAALKEKLGWEPVEPQGTMYGIFKHNSETDMEAVILALERGGFGCVPCSIFWPHAKAKSGYVRIHCGSLPHKRDAILQRLMEN